MAKTFGFESTTDEVLEGIDLSGRRALITGVSAGLGVETARAVVAHGGTVVGSARDLQKARRALAAALPADTAVELVKLTSPCSATCAKRRTNSSRRANLSM